MSFIRQWIFIVFSIIILANPASAQGILTLLETDSNLPVEGAVISGNGKEGSFQVVTDKFGTAEIRLSPPFLIQVRHLGYEIFADSVFQLPRSVNLAPRITGLDEVVVTGQYEPQSATNSVYQVRTINIEKISSKGAGQVSDILNQELNIRLNNDPALGSTGLSIQGISGQNVKVLVDGVPLVGRTGTAVDINQINLNSIDKIEIVEGPMAVSYGANALAGVINIITRKSQERKTQLSLEIQEETAGSSYGITEGRHNQNLNVGHRISESTLARVELARNYFGGYQGQSTGRVLDWDPKTQYTAGFLLQHLSGYHRIHYRLDYLDELIENNAPPSGLFDPIALDEEYRTGRWMHQLQYNTRLGNWTYNSVISRTDYERIKTQFSTRLSTGEQTLSSAEGALDTTVFNTTVFRGTFLNLPKSSNIQFEIGYDINLDETGGQRIKDDQLQRIQDYGFFASGELVLFENLKIRPGIRYSLNSVFDAPVTPSVNLKYDLNNWSVRAAYGRGFRAPTLRELYFEFIDSSHRILGNPDLDPELADHFDLSVSKNFSDPGLSWEAGLTLFHNSIRNQIAFGQSEADPTATTFINIDSFRSLGATLRARVKTEKWEFNFGSGYTGRATDAGGIGTDEYLYSPEITTDITYRMPELNAGLNLFHKYTGKLPNYILTSDDDLLLSEIDDYHWIDLSFNKQIKNSIRITAGIRNVLDVTDVNSSGGSGGSVHGGGSAIPVGIGRSGFLRIKYTFNSKQ